MQALAMDRWDQAAIKDRFQTNLVDEACCWV